MGSFFCCAKLRSKEKSEAKDNEGLNNANEERKTERVSGGHLSGIDESSETGKIFEVFSASENSGRWICSFPEKSCIIPEDAQSVIETDYLLGKLNSIFHLEGKEVRIRFSDKTLSSDDGDFSVDRLAKNKVMYGWVADDGTVRPFCLELWNILDHSHKKKIRVLVKGELFEVDLIKKTYTDVTKAKEYSIKEVDCNKV